MVIKKAPTSTLDYKVRGVQTGGVQTISSVLFMISTHGSLGSKKKQKKHVCQTKSRILHSALTRTSKPPSPSTPLRSRTAPRRAPPWSVRPPRRHRQAAIIKPPPPPPTLLRAPPAPPSINLHHQCDDSVRPPSSTQRWNWRTNAPPPHQAIQTPRPRHQLIEQGLCRLEAPKPHSRARWRWASLELKHDRANWSRRWSTVFPTPGTSYDPPIGKLSE